MNSNTGRKGIKGGRLIGKEAGDSVLSKALGQDQLLIVSQLSIFKLHIHSLTVFRNECQIASNQISRQFNFNTKLQPAAAVALCPYSLSSNYSVDVAFYQQSLKTFWYVRIRDFHKMPTLFLLYCVLCLLLCEMQFCTCSLGLLDSSTLHLISLRSCYCVWR